MELLNLWIALGLLAIGLLTGMTVSDLCWRAHAREIEKSLKLIQSANAYAERLVR